MAKPQMKVEDILKDIRRQVLDENGAVAGSRSEALVGSDHEGDASAARILTFLKTTEQLRGSLPPVRSYRGGVKAKIEVWIKGKVRRATKWFFFDQVNFNSTVHQLLAELNDLQLRHRNMLEDLGRSLRLEAQEREQRRRNFNEEQKAINADHRLSIEKQRALNEQQTLINKEQSLVSEEQRLIGSEQAALIEAQNATIERLRIELSESAVVIDRLRRNFEHRLAQLEHPDPNTRP
jgi:hypothetical protein